MGYLSLFAIYRMLYDKDIDCKIIVHAWVCFFFRRWSGLNAAHLLSNRFEKILDDKHAESCGTRMLVSWRLCWFSWAVGWPTATGHTVSSMTIFGEPSWWLFVFSRRLPNFLEFLSYMFNFQTILVGPLFYYRDFEDFITGHNVTKHQVNPLWSRGDRRFGA